MVSGRFHARTVEQCWQLARQHAEYYQARINELDQDGNSHQAALYRAALRAVDHLALTILNGPCIGPFDYLKFPGQPR